MRISQSREGKEQLIAKQLILAAALCISLPLGASSARAQADTTVPPANITILSNLGPSNTDPYFTDTSIVTLNGGCITGKPSVNDHQIALGHDHVALVSEGVRQTLNESEESVASRSDVGTVLNVIW